ncbi:MAG TPA: TauD/TfdA family dioxygenase [Casimicrobiaceae bacterium]|nr:TauD/TfdA family dioxygenase [Casimicrobiaceae bacterium]
MLKVHPTGAILGATVEGADLSRPLDDAALAMLVRALAEHGVLCFPAQSLDAQALRRFSAQFGTLEINVTGKFQEPGLPEVMILSNMVENGTPLGLSDAGQDWHTDMSYSGTIAYANVLHGIRIPRRNGQPLGDTQFASMAAAYDTLPGDVKETIATLRAVHDFAKFWDNMRKRPGSTRPPLSDTQRAQKPPVTHPMVLQHPITRRPLLYVNPGYAVRVDGLPAAESDALLAFLFEHQLQPRFRYAHHWTEGDLLVWDDLVTLHHAVADYAPHEHRLIKRCQVMADRVFDPAWRARLERAASATPDATTH